MDFIRPLPAYRGGMGMAQLSLKELQDMFKAYLQDLLGKDGVRVIVSPFRIRQKIFVIIRCCRQITQLTGRWIPAMKHSVRT